MTIYRFANNAKTTIAEALTPSATELIVAAGTGSIFPSLEAGFIAAGTLSNSTGTIREIVTITDISGDIFTIVRGQENTSALSWPSGSRFQELVTSAQLGSFVQWEDLGIPYKQVDLGSGGGTAVLDLGELPVGAPIVMILLTAGAPIEISDITGATLGLLVILAIEESSSEISIPLDTPPFLLSNISGDVGWPGFPLSMIGLTYNPINTLYKWVEQSRTWRTA